MFLLMLLSLLLRLLILLLRLLLPPRPALVSVVSTTR